MRSVSILIVALLGLSGFAKAAEEDGDSDSASVSSSSSEESSEESSEDIFFDEDLWEEARKQYEETVMQAFINGTAHSNSRRNTKTTPFSDQYHVHSNTFHIYSDLMNKTHKISKRQAASSSTPAQCTNPSTSHCSNFVNSRFRTLDGTCNNVNNQVWGAVNRPFNRLLAPGYYDGFNQPSGGINSFLPNPRKISVTVHSDSGATNLKITNMVPQFGQFLDHDMTLTPEASSPCCSNPGSNQADCWSINTQGDSFLNSFGSTCMDFTRSTPCLSNGVRQQMNANTAFIDGSQIYGSSITRSNSLRTFSGGRLRTNPNLQGFLPIGTSVGIQVQGSFAAGDDRINEMPGLAVMHTVWLKEHNRIASVFQSIRPSWNDEKIYQESRRIVGALLQRVTYNEYLPIILGPGAMSSYNLDVSTWSNYNSQADPTIYNSFATAAYRFGHSLIAGIVRLLTATNTVAGTYNIKDEYFLSRQITQNNGQGYDMILRGLMTGNAPEMDRFVTSGVTNFLFKPQTANFGSDLVARNIQRGRDHGLANYNSYRTGCGGSDISSASWSITPPNISPDGWRMASQVYPSPNQIDLFVGGLIEIPVAGGLSGPTFTCLKARQFSNTKFGDRYFYTHNLATGFTSDQLADITRQTMGDIICRNGQQPNTPPNVFLATDPSRNIDCSARPNLNLNLY